MKSNQLRYVSQARAAMLIGISEHELCKLSGETGYGHVEHAGDHDELFFTYEELRLICQVAIHMVN